MTACRFAVEAVRQAHPDLQAARIERRDHQAGPAKNLDFLQVHIVRIFSVSEDLTNHNPLE